jgi:hypothetical protein
MFECCNDINFWTYQTGPGMGMIYLWGDLGGSVGLWVGVFGWKTSKKQGSVREKRNARKDTGKENRTQSRRRERHAVAALCRVPHPFFLPRRPGSLAVVSSVFFNCVAWGKQGVHQASASLNDLVSETFPIVFVPGFVFLDSQILSYKDGVQPQQQKKKKRRRKT